MACCHFGFPTYRRGRVTKVLLVFVVSNGNSLFFKNFISCMSICSDVSLSKGDGGFGRLSRKSLFRVPVNSHFVAFSADKEGRPCKSLLVSYKNIY